MVSSQWCAQPFNQCHVPSTSLSNTITPSLLPPITTDTHHVGCVITANAKHPDTAVVKAIQQMHSLKDKAEVQSVLGVAGLHGNFMKDNGALTQCLK